VFRTLTNSFPICGLAVATATDSMVYKSDVYAASNLPSDGWADLADDITTTPRSSSSPRGTLRWGDKAVLILIGLRLGLDGVNPIYYDSIKVSRVQSVSTGTASLSVLTPTRC
jgi:cysteine protease ATG4